LGRDTVDVFPRIEVFGEPPNFEVLGKRLEHDNSLDGAISIEVFDKALEPTMGRPVG
jgi:hypothetical protein